MKEKQSNGMHGMYPLMQDGEAHATKGMHKSPDAHLNQTTKKFANSQFGKHPEAEAPMHSEAKHHMVQHPQHGVVDPTPGYGVPMKMLIKKHKIY